MGTFNIQTEFIFKGKFIVRANSKEEAERIVLEDCGLSLGKDIHTIANENTVDWDFDMVPEKRIIEHSVILQSSRKKTNSLPQIEDAISVSSEDLKMLGFDITHPINLKRIASKVSDAMTTCCYWDTLRHYAEMEELPINHNVFKCPYCDYFNTIYNPSDATCDCQECGTTWEITEQDKINRLQESECSADGFDEFIRHLWDKSLMPGKNVEDYKKWWNNGKVKEYLD